MLGTYLLFQNRFGRGREISMQQNLTNAFYIRRLHIADMFFQIKQVLPTFALEVLCLGDLERGEDLRGIQQFRICQQTALYKVHTLVTSKHAHCTMYIVHTHRVSHNISHVLSVGTDISVSVNSIKIVMSAMNIDRVSSCFRPPVKYFYIVPSVQYFSTIYPSLILQQCPTPTSALGQNVFF